MSATIMVQQVDANNDPIEGPNGPVFLSDIDAVAQIIGTRLKLLQGEWWEDLTIGLPFRQAMQGSSGSTANQTTVALLLQQYIAATPYVLGVLNFSFTYSSGVRRSIFFAQVSTPFGTLTVTNAPGLSAQVTS